MPNSNPTSSQLTTSILLKPVVVGVMEAADGVTGEEVDGKEEIGTTDGEVGGEGRVDMDREGDGGGNREGDGSGDEEGE